jgi:hypothetical protein
MEDPDVQQAQRPTPESVVQTLFAQQLADLDNLTGDLLDATRLTGNSRQRRLRKIFEEASRA